MPSPSDTPTTLALTDAVLEQVNSARDPSLARAAEAVMKTEAGGLELLKENEQREISYKKFRQLLHQQLSELNSLYHNIEAIHRSRLKDFSRVKKQIEK